MLVFGVLGDQLSPLPLGNALELFLRRTDAEELIATVCEDEPEWAAHLHVVELLLDAGSRN